MSIFGAIGYPQVTDLSWLRNRFWQEQGGVDHFALYEAEDGRLICLGQSRPPTSETVVYDGLNSPLVECAVDSRTARTLQASLSGVERSFALAAYNGRTVFLAATDRPLYYLATDQGKTVFFASQEDHLLALAAFGTRPAKLDPYSVLDLTTRECMTLGRRYVRRAVVIAAGDLDGCATAKAMAAHGFEIRLLYFPGENDLGEIGRVAATALALEGDYHVLHPGVFAPGDTLSRLAKATEYAQAHGCHAIALGWPTDERGQATYRDLVRLYQQLLPHVTPVGYQLDMVSPARPL